MYRPDKSAIRIEHPWDVAIRYLIALPRDSLATSLADISSQQPSDVPSMSVIDIVRRHRHDVLEMPVTAIQCSHPLNVVRMSGSDVYAEVEMCRHFDVLGM
jgi:hypothetical protein